MWQVYAVLSAVFASLTALFSKMGVRGIDSNLATAVRVSFILILVWGIVIFTGKVGEVRSIQPRTMLFLFLFGHCHRSLVAFLLQGPAARRRVPCCPH